MKLSEDFFKGMFFQHLLDGEDSLEEIKKVMEEYNSRNKDEYKALEDCIAEKYNTIMRG